MIIPCYCCTETIGRAVASIAAQTVKPAEVLLVNDCSGDHTEYVLQELKTKHPPGWIKIIQLDMNVGPAAARNAGWEVASQPYIAFLDADDTWHPRKIEIQYSWMTSNPDAALTGHRSCKLTKKVSLNLMESDKSEIQNPLFSKISFRQLLLSNRFSTPSVIIRRDIAQRFNPDFRRCEDYLLWCEILASGRSAYQLCLPLAFTHKSFYGDGGLSGDLVAMEKDELRMYLFLRSQEKLSTIRCVILLTWSVLRYLRRVLIVKASSLTQ